MKLILSSCDFRNEKSQKVIMDNLPYPIDKCRLLFIPNEKATAEAISGDVYYDRMQEFGFAKENVYVFDHNNPDKFRNLNIDVIYISGGNTFGTLDKIRKSNFDKDIIRYVKSGVVYIGGSAGAHIVSKSIKHVEKYDENAVGLTDYSALGLFDGVLICHYTDSRKSVYEELKATSEYNVYKLDNEESIIINQNGNNVHMEFKKSQKYYESRKAYYEQNTFVRDMVSLMMPDVVQYVRNVFYSLRCAKASREIFEDITKQIIETRQKHKKFYNSTQYTVGSLLVDSREFAQRNIREWCEYIDKTNDSIAQILNIVFKLGYNPWDNIKSSNIVKQLKHQKEDALVELCQNYSLLIDKAKRLNNFSKHSLNIWATERISPKSIEMVDYKIKFEGCVLPASDIVSLENEKKVECAIVDILDYVFEYLTRKNPQRKYVMYKYDVEQNGDVETIWDIDVSEDLIIDVFIESEKQNDGTHIIKSVYAKLNSNPEKEIELASLYNFNTSVGVHYNIGIVEFDSVDVYVNEKLVGKYVLDDKKDVSYLHFKSFSFHPNER